MDEKKVAMIYGMQRTGTNYTEQLIIRNFDHVKFYNRADTRCLPSHKHFRLYDENFFLPDSKFYNSFCYKDFNSFKNHVEQLIGLDINYFLVIIKNPFSWYLSYLKHAKKSGYSFHRKSLNSHFIIDYNLFYRKWLSFQQQSPEKVIILKYEDSLNDLPLFLDGIAGRLNMKRNSDNPDNPEKVRINRRFTTKKLAYYKNQSFMGLIKDNDKKTIINLLDIGILDIYDIK